MGSRKTKKRYKSAIRSYIRFAADRYNLQKFVNTGQKHVAAYAEEMKKAERNLESIVNFTAIIEKYLDIKELNKTVLNELIDKIGVHKAEKIDGERVQKVDIYYRFVGNLN